MSPVTIARKESRTFHTLDALRGVAALAVLLFHAAFFYGISPPAEGQIAVDLFFVMSGFIIAYRYDAPLRGGLSATGFIKRRLIRLYPLFLLGSLFGVVPALIAVATHAGGPVYPETLESLPLAIFMLPSRLALPVLQEAYPLNYVAWSLALEVFINIVYVATFRFWTVPRLIGIVAFGFVLLCVTDYHYGTLNVGFAWAHYPGGFARILYGFMAGVLMYRLYETKPFRRSLPWWCLLPIVLCLFFCNPSSYRAWWELGVVAVVVPAIVAAAVASEPPRWAQGACAMAGIYSYVVYSLHAPMIAILLRVESRLPLHGPMGFVIKAVAFTGVVLGIATLAHYAYDKPVRRWLTARLDAPRRRPLFQFETAAKS